MIDTRMFTADFPWFFVVLALFYAIRFFSNSDKNKSQPTIPTGKKMKKPIASQADKKDTYRKIDMPRQGTTTPAKEHHKPKMFDEKHSNPMHQEVYKSKDILHYDYGELESLDDSIEKSKETLTDAMNQGKYAINAMEKPASIKHKIKILHKEYSPKELVVLQTILDKKF